MFTGIIQATGTIAKVQNTKQGRFIAIKTDPKIAPEVPKGGSVAIDGVCLTNLGGLTFELMDATLKRTTLGARKVGDIVNVEPAMRVGDSIGGHFISGHVDTVGSVRKIETRWHTQYLTIHIPKLMVSYLVPQGSIVVNGVSLTIVESGDDWFSVALTSYTLKHTNLSSVRTGDTVNIEVDILAKYLKHFVDQVS